MNATLIAACWRERLSRPVAVVLLVILMVLGLVVSVSTKSLADVTLGLTLVLGAGLVGRDVSSGSLALLLTRPLRRSEYLLSRWFAGSLAAATLGVVQLALQFLLLRLRSVELTGGALAYECARAVSLAFGLTATLVFLSTLVRGIGDVGLWLVAVIVASVLAPAGAVRASDELLALMVPRVDWGQSLNAQPIAWFPIVSFVSSLVLYLALGIVILNRKELSYASHA